MPRTLFSLPCHLPQGASLPAFAPVGPMVCWLGMDKEPSPTIRDLYPNLNGEELRQAEENLEQYLALALRVYERVASAPQTYAQFRTLIDTDGTLGLGTLEE